MADDRKRKPSAPSRLSSVDDPLKAVSVSPQPGRVPHEYLWPAILWLTLLFVGGGLAFLWPVFEAVGAGVAVGMIAAVLILSLTPLLLLRTILKRVPAERNDGPAPRGHERRKRP